MNDDHQIGARLHAQSWGANDGTQLSFEPVPHHRPFQAPLGAQANADPSGVIGQASDRKEASSRPAASSIDRSKCVVALQAGWGGKWADDQGCLGWNELPAPFPSTPVQRPPASGGAHASEESVGLDPFPV